MRFLFNSAASDLHECSFNSLYEIRVYGVAVTLTIIASFNSLYEILEGFPRPRTDHTGYFQFSLWDSKSLWRACYDNASSDFQFSLWDSDNRHGCPRGAFQFSLWDSQIRLSAEPGLFRKSFNSLYEILRLDFDCYLKVFHDSFNSLYEILLSLRIFIGFYNAPFNSLYEILVLWLMLMLC